MGEDDDTLLLSGDMYVMLSVVRIHSTVCKVTLRERGARGAPAVPQ